MAPTTRQALERNVKAEPAPAPALMANDCFPTHGRPYLIRHKPTQKILTVVQTTLDPTEPGGKPFVYDSLCTTELGVAALGSFLWLCSTSSGWFQFRNYAHGTYISTAERLHEGCFTACQMGAAVRSDFCPPYRLGGRDGGYVLALPVPPHAPTGTLIHEEHVLTYMGLGEHGMVVRLNIPDGADVWEFVDF